MQLTFKLRTDVNARLFEFCSENSYCF